MGRILYLHLDDVGDVLGPVGVEIVEVPQEGCIGFGIDVKYFLHLDLEGAGAKSIEFIREVLIQLQHILAVDDGQAEKHGVIER